jgi:hypothetical protein
MSLDCAAAMWGDDMAWLRIVVTAAGNHDPKLDHPVLGPLPLTRALRLALAHVRWHMPKLDARLGRPAVI